MPGGFCGKAKGYVANDEYYTPNQEWDKIKQHIPKDKVIWEAFYGDGKSGEYLKTIGFNVVSNNEDFFVANHGDVVVSNPPFSKKREVVQRLVKLDKPFILIMPLEVLTYKYIEPIRNHLQVMIPKQRMIFLKEGKSVKFNYDCIFFCYKMNLPKDLIYV
jgi:hypothetical protein